MSRRPPSAARKLQRLILAAVPMLLAAAVVGASTAVRVTTPVKLEMAVRGVTFTVAEGRAVPLLNDSTVFAKLTIEGCEAVSFPPLNIGGEAAPPVPSPGTVTFRCDPRVPGSKVRVRGEGESELGNIERILAPGGEQVGLELTGTTPASVRVEMSRGTSFVFSLARNIPFDIVTEFAGADGMTVPDDPDGVVTYRASLTDAHVSRQATVLSGRSLNLVVEPGGASVAALFRDDVSIPIESISMFQRSDVDEALVSTAIDGTLTYQGSAGSVRIRKGESVRFRSDEGFRLTGLRVDLEHEGLALTLEGDAEELAIGGTDRRLKLFDRVVSDRNRTLLGIVVVIASQFAWLRQYWWPGRKEK